jgi:succinate dehydrogenase assembly factor 2
MNRLSFPARLGFSFLPSTRVRSYTQPSKLVPEHDKKAELFRDPWPLPHSPEHIKATTQDANKLPLSLPRHGESADVLRARLVYQTRKRGTLESDLLMSTFAHEWHPKLSEGELREFDKARYSSGSSFFANESHAAAR